MGWRLVDDTLEAPGGWDGWMDGEGRT